MQKRDIVYLVIIFVLLVGLVLSIFSVLSLKSDIDRENKVKENQNDLQNHAGLSAAYLQAGERLKAVEALEIAIGLFPEFKEQGEYYVNEIRAGRNP